MKKIVLALGLLLGLNTWAAKDDSLTTTQAGCRAFIAKLSSTPGMSFGTVLVPEDWENPSGSKIPLFWWKRSGSDSSAPPIAFLHGGVAGTSWGLLDKWQKVIQDYPGDLVSFDHRGEGCSKTLPSNLNPEAYRHLTVRATVKDMEFLRSEVFGYSRWRIVGHSRGAALVHYYLEMAPEGLESAHAMGFAISSPERQRLNTLTRAQGFYDTAKAYLLRYPEDEAKVKKIRALITADTCWQGLDERKICGPAALDVFANYLSRVSSWGDLHAKIASMIDFDSTYKAIQARLLIDVYGHFNYVVATNGQTFGSPDSLTTAQLKNNPIYHEAFLSEARYIGDAIAPWVDIPWSSSVDPLDYGKVKKFLSNHPDFKYYLYSGALDPIAPPQSFSWEVDHLGSLVQFVNLPEVGHDGWFDPIFLANIMKP